MRYLPLAVLITQFASSVCFAAGLVAYPAEGAAGTDSRSFVIGWKFSLTSQVTVTGLAYLDVTGRGLNVPHMVGIFDANSAELLVSSTVPAGPLTAFRDGFRYVPASYVLRPGTYVMAGMSPSDADPVIRQSVNIRTPAQVTYLEERELQSTAFTMPTGHLSLDEKGDFGPTFLVDEISQTNAVTGIANAAGGPAGFAPATYVSLYGAGLSDSTRAWARTDFSNGTGLPVSLDGVSVTVGGSPAWVEFVSPGQINFITPDIAPSPAGVPVVLKAPGKPDITMWIDLRPVAPALFTWLTGTADSGLYVVAQHADYSNLGKSGLFPDKSASFTTPARPGETIVLYGTGFGPTLPQHPSSSLVDNVYPLATAATATVGGLGATVRFAGLIPPLASVYQFNVTLPTTLPSGDLPLVVTVNGVGTLTGTISVRN